MDLQIIRKNKQFQLVNAETNKVFLTGKSAAELSKTAFGQARFAKINKVRFPQGKTVYYRKEAVAPKNNDGASPAKKPKAKNRPSVPIAWVVGGDGAITVFHNGKAHTIAKSNGNYNKLREALNSQQYAKIEALLSPAQCLINYSVDSLKIKAGVVTYRGETLKNYLVDKIFELYNTGHAFKPVANFLNNVMANPNRESAEAAYAFLEHKGLPITEDGCFLGYKKVRDDLMDWHSGTIKNEVGTVVKHPRASCDTNRLNDCGNGLHVGTFQYAYHDFHSGAGKVLLVKVNPKDIVSVPCDSRGQKIRVCEYLVLSVYDGEEAIPEVIR